MKILNQQKAYKNDGLLFKKVSNARLDKGLPLNANFSSWKVQLKSAVNFAPIIYLFLKSYFDK